MHPRVLAQRSGAAQQRMQEAAHALAEQHGLDRELAASLAVYDRDPETRGVMRQEAVADLLHALVRQGAKERRKAEREAAQREAQDELADAFSEAQQPGPEEETPEEAGEPQQCEAISARTGEPCQRKARDGSRFCYSHRDQDADTVEG